MTVSTVDIPVLHYVDVVHLYPQVVYPILPGFARHFRGEWLGIHYEPLQSSTSFRKPATVSEKGNIGIPRLKIHRSMIDPRISLYAATLTPLPIQVRCSSISFPN
jgi:hypothetical protein